MEHDAFYEYEDADVVMRLPIYLRQSKGIRLFKPDRRRGKVGQIFAVSLTLIADEGHRAAIRDSMNAAKPSDWMGVQTRVFRLGTIAGIEGGFEMMLTSLNSINGDVVHNYDALFPLSEIYVHLGVGGKGELALFDVACHEIASSIRLKEPAGDLVVEQECPQTPPQPRAPVDSLVCLKHEPVHPGTYLTAKARIRSKFVDSALILPDEDNGGVRLFQMSKIGGSLLPAAGCSWHESTEAAKAHALETLKIRESDWVVREGEPEWARAFKDATAAAIKAYTDAVPSDPPKEG